MIQTWIGVHQEQDGCWLCIATDVKGDEITHDRAIGAHAALGMVMTTLHRLYESFTIIGITTTHYDLKKAGEPYDTHQTS